MLSLCHLLILGMLTIVKHAAYPGCLLLGPVMVVFPIILISYVLNIIIGHASNDQHVPLL